MSRRYHNEPDILRVAAEEALRGQVEDQEDRRRGLLEALRPDLTQDRRVERRSVVADFCDQPSAPEAASVVRKPIVR